MSGDIGEAMLRSSIDEAAHRDALAQRGLDERRNAMTDFTTGREFGQGVASWFGLDAACVALDMKVTHGGDEALSVTLTILLTPEDIVGIGNRMRELAKGSKGIVSVDEAKPQTDAAYAQARMDRILAGQESQALREANQDRFDRTSQAIE